MLIDGLATFPGVARRFERKGTEGEVSVVDDYAHHPAEIAATLSAARSIHDGRIVAVFQPHRFTRTRDCWEDFARCFAEADVVVLSEIYSASEESIQGIDSESLATAISEAGHTEARFGGGLDTIADGLPAQLRAGDLVFTLGAGDIVGLGPRLLAALKSKTGRDD